MSHKENLILKNQRELNNILPVAQLGSKFTRLANRFASKTNHSAHQNLLSKDDQIINEVFTLNKIQKERAAMRNTHSRAESSFQGTQLEYFRSINRQQKQEILKLREDLKIINEKMTKTIDQRKKAQEKLFMCHRLTNRSQRKIGKVMDMAHQLLKMIKQKISQPKDTNQQISKLQEPQEDWTEEQFDTKSNFYIEEKSQISECVPEQRKPNNTKKKTIDIMLFESKRLQRNDMMREKYIENFPMKSNDLFSESVIGFEKQVKELGVLHKLLKEISDTFDSAQKMPRKSTHPPQMFQDPCQMHVLQQIGTFFSKILENKQMQLHSSSKIHSCVVNEMIKPYSTRLKLYNSIKEIFDHQIYLLQNQKMLFLQFKNKRLLKFIYECSGCERYEQMLVEMFRIIREGFAEIRVKIVPELREKGQNDGNLGL